jgi:hypothetical protein
VFNAYLVTVVAPFQHELVKNLEKTCHSRISLDMIRLLKIYQCKRKHKNSAKNPFFSCIYCRRSKKSYIDAIEFDSEDDTILYNTTILSVLGSIKEYK